MEAPFERILLKYLSTPSYSDASIMEKSNFFPLWEKSSTLCDWTTAYFKQQIDLKSSSSLSNLVGFNLTGFHKCDWLAEAQSNPEEEEQAVLYLCENSSVGTWAFK